MESLHQAAFREMLGLTSLIIHVDILRPITACRDPKDDKFLSVAVFGEAHGIMSGDGDLLELHPFQDIPIYSPQEFLDSI